MALRLGVIKQNKLIIHPSTLMPLVSFVLLPQVYEPSLNFNILTIANCVSTIVINNGVKNLCLHWFCLGKKVGVRQITEMLSCERRGDKQPKLLHSM